LCRSVGFKREAWIAGAALLSNPYFFRDSFVFYVTLYGIFFGIWAFYFFLKDSRFSSLLTCLFLMLSLLSHQWAVAYYVCVTLWWGYEYVMDRRSLPSRTQKVLLRFGLIACSLIAPGVLFAAWKGITHPAFRAHQIHFQFSNVVFFGVFIGFWFSPLAVQELVKRRWQIVAIGGLITLLLFIPFQPVWADDQGSGLMPGIVMHLTEVTGRYGSFIPKLLRYGLFFMGMMVLGSFCSKPETWTGVNRKVLLCVLCGLTVISFSVLIGEKHFLFLLPFLLILAVPRLRGGSLITLWIVT